MLAEMAAPLKRFFQVVVVVVTQLLRGAGIGAGLLAAVPGHPGFGNLCRIGGWPDLNCCKQAITLIDLSRNPPTPARASTWYRPRLSSPALCES